MLWLGDRLDGRPMAGVVPTEATMTTRLTLGYRAATTAAPSPIGPAGTTVRGHEFHYSTCRPAGDGLALTGHRTSVTAGFIGPQLFASYLHLHLANRPDVAEHLVATAHRDEPQSGDR